MISTHDSRESVRSEMRARRRALDTTARRLATEALVELITALPAYRSAQHVAAYVAVDGEIDPQPLLQHAYATGKQLYLPVVGSGPDARLTFHAWTPSLPMQPNRFHIPEPAVTGNGRAPESLDLVLVPLVAFDPRGQRLGMGAGFYDRSFSFLKMGGHPMLLGLAYEFQRLEHLQEASWDVPLSGVVTERQVYLFSESGTTPP